MDQLSEYLQPYKGVVAKSAEIVTMLQMFSGVTMCNDIRKAGISDEFPIMPFLGGVVFSLINLQYGVIVRDSAIINVSFVGFGLGVIYTVFYYFYTSNAGKGVVWGKIGIGGAITAAVIAYAKYEDPANLEFRFGLLMTVFLFAMVGAPLMDLGTIIKNKSVGQMPFAMILIGTIVGILWLLYSIILNNSMMIFQNVVMVAMSLMQLSLFAIYPNKEPVGGASEKESAAKKKSKKAE